MAISLNVDRILKLKGVPERAHVTVLLLLTVVLVSIVGLIPDQSSTALGAELLGLGLLLAIVIGGLTIQSLPEPPRDRSWVISRLLLSALGTVPVIVGAASLLAETGGGLYWVVGGIVFAIAGAVENGWVLMIEILR